MLCLANADRGLRGLPKAPAAHRLEEYADVGADVLLTGASGALPGRPRETQRRLRDISELRDISGGSPDEKALETQSSVRSPEEGLSPCRGISPVRLDPLHPGSKPPLSVEIQRQLEHSS